MWDALPIQRTSLSGPEFSTIVPDFPYPNYPDVYAKRWRDVDAVTRRWAMSVWCVHFGIRRCLAGPDDLFLWIPHISTLLSKCGTFHGIPMASVHCNYVDPAHRGKGIAQKMILTMAHTLSPRKFIFELQNVPASLGDAVPFLRFSYMWIPNFSSFFQIPTVEIPVDARNIPGFHPDSWEGYRMFVCKHDGRRILVDPHDDIVWFDGGGVMDLMWIDIPCSSRYVRWFSPHGNIRVYAQNMYFSAPNYSIPTLIG